MWVWGSWDKSGGGRGMKGNDSEGVSDRIELVGIGERSKWRC